jgi:alkanesulfonate monooxygenase SsuD/methylene tetrahydromethanopterin reductase-like flavin-dependent oxidoreductase (luciferase family)
MWKEADAIPEIESAWTYDHLYLFAEAIGTEAVDNAAWGPTFRNRLRGAAKAILKPRREETFGPCLDGWMSLAALLQATRRIRGGCLVTGMVYRHPAVLAHMAATVDIISGGRLELGLGTGWSEREAAAYGLRVGSWTERYDRFDEGVECLVNLFRAEEVTSSGTHYELSGARLEPKPLQRPGPPILIAGTAKRTLATVARSATIWQAGFDLAALPLKRAKLWAECSLIGRDPQEITTAMLTQWDGFRIGSLQRSLDELRSAGVELAIITVNDPRSVAKLDKVISGQ